MEGPVGFVVLADSSELAEISRHSMADVLGPDAAGSALVSVIALGEGGGELVSGQRDVGGLDVRWPDRLGGPTTAEVSDVLTAIYQLRFVAGVADDAPIHVVASIDWSIHGALGHALHDVPNVSISGWGVFSNFNAGVVREPPPQLVEPTVVKTPSRQTPAKTSLNLDRALQAPEEPPRQLRVSDDPPKYPFGEVPPPWNGSARGPRGGSPRSSVDRQVTRAPSAATTLDGVGREARWFGRPWSFRGIGGFVAFLLGVGVSLLLTVKQTGVFTVQRDGVFVEALNSVVVLGGTLTTAWLILGVRKFRWTKFWMLVIALYLLICPIILRLLAMSRASTEAEIESLAGRALLVLLPFLAANGVLAWRGDRMARSP